MNREDRTKARFEALYDAMMKTEAGQIVSAGDYPMFIVSLMAASELSNIADELRLGIGGERDDY